MRGPPDNTVHIDAPELLTARERTRDAFATAVLWGIYVYLWVPLVSLLAWWLGFEFAYDVMVRAGGAATLRAVLANYAIAVGVIFAGVTLWSFSNRWRFRHANRRRAAAAVSEQQLAVYFGVEIATITDMREARRLSVSFDADGRIEVGPHGGVAATNDPAPTPRTPRSA